MATTRATPRRARRAVGGAAESALGDLEQHRRELTRYCFRRLGSVVEADDAAQETILRAWRCGARFEGRSTVRTWLYRIATNVCLDMRRRPQGRALPVGLGPSPETETVPPALRAPGSSARPVRLAAAQPGADDPADRAVARESVRLAFATALRHLPPRQVAVLILRDVLRWPAADVAALLDTTVIAVNSAVLRARATLADAGAGPRHPDPPGTADRDRLARYLDAFERSDVQRLVALLREHAVARRPVATPA